MEINKIKEVSDSEMSLSSTKEILMSYMAVTAYREWGIYAERLLLRLLEMCQGQFTGLNFKHGASTRPLEPDFSFAKEVGEHIEVTMPISQILPTKDSTNHKNALKGIKTLMSNVITFDDFKRDENGDVIYDEAGKPKELTVMVQVLNKVKMDKDLRGHITMLVDKDIWKWMINYSKGFRAIDLDIAMRFKSKNSLRFYELMSRQTTPITFTIDELRKMFGTGDKYKRTYDFIKRVVEPSKKELDSCSPYSFEYKENTQKSHVAGVYPTTSITFYPVRLYQYDTVRSQNGMDRNYVFLNEKVRNYLYRIIGFDSRQLENNLELFMVAEEHMSKNKDGNPDLLSFLMAIYSSAQRKRVRNLQGYVVSSLKKHLKEKYNIDFKSNAAKEKEAEAMKKIQELSKAQREKAAKSKDGDIKTLGDFLLK